MITCNWKKGFLVHLLTLVQLLTDLNKQSKQALRAFNEKRLAA